MCGQERRTIRVVDPNKARKGMENLSDGHYFSPGEVIPTPYKPDNLHPFRDTVRRIINPFQRPFRH